MRFNRLLSRGLLAATASVVALTACTSAHENVTSQDGASLPAAVFQIAHLTNGALPFGKPLRLKVSNGALSAVKVRQAGAGLVAGSFNPTRTSWHSAAPLAPSSKLHATVSYADLAHHTTRRSLKISTPSAKHHFSDVLSPDAGATVGIGSVVSVSFDQAIPTKKQAAVQKALTVTTKPAVVGAWHWMSDQVVHWRPPTYWKPGTKVAVTSDLQGVNLGHGVWGDVGEHKASFKIGASHISEADQATHEMKIYDNNKLIKTFPISTGRPQYPTMDGVHVALQKNSVIQMNSATVGIPKGNPDYYDETVYWDVRISNGGEFVHAAPWSVGEQGSVNVSHGCVNLSTENAEWFYNWAQVGDVVDIFNGVRAPESGDAGTADWNMSWHKWLAGGADPSAAAKALHPLLPRDSEPNFRPQKHSAGKHHGSTKHIKTHSAKKHSATTQASKKSASST